LRRNFWLHTRHRHRPYYLLGIGSYTAGDFNMFGAFPQKKYRWGYFPLTMQYGEELWQKKNSATTVKSCWAGRFIPLKKPEQMLRLARDLRKGGYDFRLQMVGAGEMEKSLKEMARAYQVEDRIIFHGVCSPNRVREIMEECHILVLTSNRIEGWGAVINEAMNSGLAVVASSCAGAPGFLIENGENGFIYRGGSFKAMKAKVRRLLDDPELRERMGRKAYQTINELWNAEKAAEELLRVSSDLLAGKGIIPALAGPFSRSN
jgi:glycosyltransferase involved in cell wall biosynthesis